MGKLANNDITEIEAVLNNWEEGWNTSDASLAAQDYSCDADWVNAFGVVRKGREEIESFLAGVFQRPFVKNRTHTRLEEKIQLISEDVAYVVSKGETEGQLTHDFKPLGTRKTSHLRVLRRTPEGWKIFSHLISDAREAHQPVHQ